MRLSVNGQPAYAYTGGKTFNPELPTVVFIHGAQHDHSVWILQSRYLAHHGYGVLALDLPGHGKSGGPALASVEQIAAWVFAVLDAAGVAKAALIGHSMGSLIALECAGAAPQRVAKIALISTANPMRVSEELLNATHDDEPLAQQMVNIWSHSTYAAKPSNPGPGFSTFGGNLRLMQRIQPGVMHADFTACNAYARGEERAKQVACPALLVLGESDMMAHPKGARGLQAAIPGQRTILVKSSGHALMAEQPDAVLDALKAFLA
ncbi:MAG: Alpha/beta hydrolase [Betaproteobacteria bacterium]|nr:Alpha/beta hydrolase [Betaproteobacteria bacterium]